MCTTFRVSAFAFAAILASAGPSLAVDPAGSAPSTRVPAEPTPQALPLPGRTPGPTDQDIGHFGLPEFPGENTQRFDSTVDEALGILTAANPGTPTGNCDGLIPCCNTAQDAACDFVTFDIACVDAGGFIHIDEMPDGSIQYSCPAP